MSFIQPLLTKPERSAHECVYSIIDIDKCIREPVWVEEDEHQPTEYWNYLHADTRRLSRAVTLQSCYSQQESAAHMEK